MTPREASLEAATLLLALAQPEEPQAEPETRPPPPNQEARAEWEDYVRERCAEELAAAGTVIAQAKADGRYIEPDSGGFFIIPKHNRAPEGKICAHCGGTIGINVNLTERIKVICLMCNNEDWKTPAAIEKRKNKANTRTLDQILLDRILNPPPMADFDE